MRIDSVRTPSDMAKAMSDDLFGASDMRQSDYVASDANVALLTQLPEREDCVAFLNAFTTRTQKPDEFIQRNAGMTLCEGLLKDGDGERLQFRQRFVLFRRLLRLTRGCVSQQTEAGLDKPQDYRSQQSPLPLDHHPSSGEQPGYAVCWPLNLWLVSRLVSPCDTPAGR